MENADDTSESLPDKPLTVHSVMTDQERFPDLGGIDYVILKEGPLKVKLAKRTAIQNRYSGEHHHDAVTIQTIFKNKGNPSEDEKRTITLEGNDEIGKLSDFLLSVRNQPAANAAGEYLVVSAPVGIGDAATLQAGLNSLTASGKVDVLAEVLGQAAKDGDLFRCIVNRAERDPHLFAEASVALNFIRCRAAVDQLQNLINADQGVGETPFQALLEQNPWMFGSEYSQLLDRRQWSRDDKQDFMLRRTTDGYIELIEIKTPLKGRCPFVNDRSHDTCYPSADLSQVIGQVLDYIEELEADRNSILRKDNEDTCKIRARVVIGRDGDVSQMRALRRLNGHLHRVEVIIFDQLYQMAENVLAYLGTALRP